MQIGPWGSFPLPCHHTPAALLHLPQGVTGRVGNHSSGVKINCKYLQFYLEQTPLHPWFLPVSPPAPVPTLQTSWPAPMGGPSTQTLFFSPKLSHSKEGSSWPPETTCPRGALTPPRLCSLSTKTHRDKSDKFKQNGLIFGRAQHEEQAPGVMAAPRARPWGGTVELGDGVDTPPL